MEEPAMPNSENKRRTLLGQLGLGVALSTFALTGCAVEAESSDLGETEGAIVLGNPNDANGMQNPTGRHRIMRVGGGNIDTNPATNPFFRSMGTNGRACVDCHQPAAAMGITPPQVRQIFDQTQGLDPVFRLNDGANGPLAPVGTLDQRRRAYSMLLNKGNIRIPMTLPGNRDFDIRVVLDPYAGTGANPPLNQTVPAGASPIISVYRRPLLSANTRFISAVMWDGREAAAANAVATTPGSGQRIPAHSSGAPVFRNMRVQSNNATLGHAEGASNIAENIRDQIVSFQMNLVVAQQTDNAAGALNNGANGGAAFLLNQDTFFGINDSHGGNPIAGTAFNPNAMTIYNGWNGRSGRQGQIARGQAIFNTKLIRISGVRGVNDALGVATLNGSCTTCHSHPNVGNHTDILPLDVGISTPGESDNVHPVFRITNRANGQAIETTDPGRALVTGRFADLNKQKGPTLRALSSRAPYFHNGSADNLREVIDFYNRRFGIGFNAAEIADLQAFLEAL
jgi:hypothetical protein